MTDVRADLKKLRNLGRTIGYNEKTLKHFLTRKETVERFPDTLYKQQALDEIVKGINKLQIDIQMLEAAKLESKYIEAFEKLPEDIKRIMIERFFFGKRIDEISMSIGWCERTVNRRIKEGIHMVEEVLK